jgi:predicted regulator of Ras-like GTPase activity (Roadblock/LC7/MglB family)
MAIEGDLHDMNLAEIIQLNCRNAEEARVSLSHEGRSGTLYFANGQVVHATHEGHSGEEAIYEMLSWPDGHFVIERDIASPQKTVHLPWSVLLLHGMQRLDEAQAQEGKEVRAERTESAQNAQGVLQELADSLDGFVAASVVDEQGVVVSLVQNERFDEKQAAAILSQETRQINQVSEAMNAGAFEESITTTEKYLFVTRPIGQGRYYAQVVITPDGNIGAARMYLADKAQDVFDSLSTGAR